MTNRSDVLMTVIVISVCLIVLFSPDEGTQAQWGEIKAAQIEDVFLRNDGDDVSSGGLRLGGGLYCDSTAEIFGALTCEDNIIANGHVIMAGGSELRHAAGFVRYYSAAEILDATCYDSGGILFAVPCHFNGRMRVPIRLAQEDFGGDFVFDQVTVFALDQADGAYITRLSLESANPGNGTITTRAENDTDLGNGTSGSITGTVLSADVGPIDEPFYLTIYSAGMMTAQDLKVTGIKVEGHRA